MGTGIWANFHWESGIWVTGTGIGSLGMEIIDRKTIELGLGFLKFGKTIGWEMGFGQNLGWKNGIYTPLHDLTNDQCKPLSLTWNSRHFNNF